METLMTSNNDAKPGQFNTYVTHASIFNRLKSTEKDVRELAWVEFRNKYAPVIAGFAKHCGASQQDIDDIIQDVVTSFFTVSQDFSYDPQKGRFRGWLKTCTVRAAIRRAGKNLKFRGVSLDDVPQVELAIEPIWNDVWEKHLVNEALSRLKSETGESATYRAFEQYVLINRPAEEVAAELGISLDSVHQAKSRMTKKLREYVQLIREAEE